jgi:hypothetical protein
MVPGRILLQSLTHPYRALDSTVARAPNSKFYYVICLFLRVSRPSTTSSSTVDATGW